ncbi:unnamed protein product [Ixodes hexagonus]
MKRDNLFRRVKSGGLGLSHLFVRKLVSRCFFLRDQNHPFLRTLIQMRLANSLTTMLVTSKCTEPAGPSGFLKEVQDAVLFLQARFSMEYLGSVTKKKLRQDLIEILFLLHCIAHCIDSVPGKTCSVV